MKRMFTVIAALGAFLVVSSHASAHEMFSGLRWSDAPYSSYYSHKVLYLGMNGDSLNSIYKNELSAAKDKWNYNSNNYVTGYLASFSSSNVDYANHASWPAAWGNLAALTLVFDVNGNDYFSGSFSGTAIRYAQIYTNPAYESFMTSSDALKLLVHETGHVMNLGHPTSSSTVSVMVTPVQYDTPQSHDRSALASYY